MKEKNERLLKENIELKNKDAQNFIPLQKKIYQSEDQLYHRKYNYIAGQVINDSYTKRNNFLTVDVGEINGVNKNMGVYNEAGIVGFVVNRSQHYALVKSVLSENFNISAKLKINQEHGILKWDGKNPQIVQLSGVPKDVEIQKGDTIVTKGSAGIFPENIPVGTVKSVRRKAGVFAAFIDVRLFTDLSSVYHVYIVKNHFKNEQQTLEKTIEEDVE